MDTNIVLKNVGSFGRYQKSMIVLLGSSSIYTAMILYSTIFTAATPNLVCNYVNSTISNNTINSKDACKIWINITKSESEHMTSLFHCEYDRTFYEDTVVTDMNLICDREYLIKLTQTLFMIGGFSVLFTGYLGDRLGRRRFIMMLLVSLLIVNIIGQILQLKMLNLSLNERYAIYSVTQFLLGALSFSLYISGYVLLLELTSEDNHTLFSTLNLYFYVLGEIIILAISYFIRHWRLINWILVFYNFFLMIIASVFLPESPSWLIVNKKYKEAIEILNKISKINGKQLTRVHQNNDTEINDEIEFYQQFIASDIIVNESKTDPEMDYKESKQILLDDQHNNTEVNDVKSTLKRMFYGKENSIKSLILSYIWIAVSLLYFGVSLGITSIDNLNPYLMVLFSSIAEIIGYSLCVFNNKFGHRRTNMFYFTCASCACLAVGLMMPHKSDGLNVYSYLIIVLSSMGKLMVSASFNTCFIYSAEMYPTNMRNFALLFLSSIGCIGSIISPQINLLGDLLFKSMPYLVFSASAFLAVFFGLILNRFKVHNHNA